MYGTCTYLQLYPIKTNIDINHISVDFSVPCTDPMRNEINISLLPKDEKLHIDDWRMIVVRMVFY